MPHLSLPAFKSALRKGDRAPARGTLRKFGTTVIEPLEDRRVRFTVSTAAVDRDGDTIAVAGWDLGAYLRNPVVLWGHCNHGLPIGKCVNIGAEGGALAAEVEFLPADMPEAGPLAEAVLRMCRTGFLSATSVGFLPLEYEVANDRDDGEGWFPPVNFLRQALLEFSVVAIPSNPEALIDPAERLAGVLPAPAPDPALEAVAQRLAADATEAERLSEVAARRKRRQLEARLIGIG